jgi:hypothetical protein
VSGRELSWPLGRRTWRQAEAWQTAARRVWSSWDAFLAAPPSRRGAAFTAHLAALDAEAAAAAEMARTAAATRL